MQQSEALCKVLRALQMLGKHPRLELLNRMLDLLIVGLEFHLGLSQYEALGPDAGARIRADAQQALLTKTVKARFMLLSHATWVDEYIGQNKPADAVADDIKDTPSANMLFNLNGMTRANWQLDSNTAMDAVELVCAQFQERLNTAILTLKRVAGSLATNSWHLEIQDGASQDMVLETGADVVALT